MEYRTSNLGFASYLYASRKLRFLRWECDNGRQVQFVFLDPMQQADVLEEAYEAGAEVPALSFHIALRTLSRMISRAIGAPRNGKFNAAGYRQPCQ